MQEWFTLVMIILIVLGAVVSVIALLTMFPWLILVFIAWLCLSILNTMF